MESIPAKIKRKLEARVSRLRRINPGKGFNFVMGRLLNFAHFFVELSVACSVYRLSTFRLLFKLFSNWTKIFESRVLVLVNLFVKKFKKINDRLPMTNIFNLKVKTLVLLVAFSTLLISNQASAANMDLSMFIMNKETSKPLEGDQNVVFAIYEGEDGLEVWSESQNVNVNYGLLKTSLGKDNNLPDNLDPLNSDYFLGIKIGSDKELAPRKKISPNPFAISAIYAQEAKTLEGKRIGEEEGDIMLLGSNGKVDNDFLNTGEEDSELVVGNDSRLHEQGTDEGTDSLGFNLGTGIGLSSGKNFDLTVSSASKKPTLRYDSSQGSWQFTNDGSSYTDFLVQEDISYSSLGEDLLPSVTDTYNIGSVEKRWDEVNARLIRAESLIIEGDATLGSAGENIIFNSSLIPSDSGLNLGSVDNPWANLYVDNITVASSSTSGTSSSHFAINTDGADESDSGLRFYRGPTINGYATLEWDGTEEQFNFYSRENLQTLGGLNVGQLGIGTTSPESFLHVSGNASGGPLVKLERSPNTAIDQGMQMGISYHHDTSWDNGEFFWMGENKDKKSFYYEIDSGFVSVGDNNTPYKIGTYAMTDGAILQVDSRDGTGRLAATGATGAYLSLINEENDSGNEWFQIVNSSNIGTNTAIFRKTALNAGSGVNIMAMDLSNGNVGIGDISPSYVLTVDHNGDGTNVAYVNDSNAWTSGSADYAEYYKTTDKDLEAGEAVCIDLTKENTVERCSRDGDSNIMGIVSTSPAFLGNAPAEERREDNDNYVVVAMLGQVPAKVTTENGELNPGDSLAAAEEEGLLRKANPGESTVGVALEAFVLEDTGEINVLISRKNKSFTVSEIETQVTERVVSMEIEDEVDILVSNAIDSLDIEDLLASFDERILTLEENQTENWIASFAELEQTQETQETYLNELTETIEKTNELVDYLTDKTLERETRIQILEDQVAMLTEESFSEEELEAINIELSSLLEKENSRTLGALATQIAYTTEGDLFQFNLDGELEVKVLGAEKIKLGEESAGKGTMLKGEEESLVEIESVNDDCKIIVTPLGSTNGKVLYVDEIEENKGFKVKLDGNALDENIEFSWIVIY